MGNSVLLTWTKQRSLPNAIFVFGIFFRFVLIKILCYIFEENIWRNKGLVSTGDNILYHVASRMNTLTIKRKVRNSNLYFSFIQDWSCIIINTTHFFLIPSFWLLSSFLLSLVKLNPLCYSNLCGKHNIISVCVCNPDNTNPQKCEHALITWSVTQ